MGSGAPARSACELLEHGDGSPPIPVLPQSTLPLASGHRSLGLTLPIARHATRATWCTLATQALLPMAAVFARGTTITLGIDEDRVYPPAVKALLAR